MPNLPTYSQVALDVQTITTTLNEIQDEKQDGLNKSDALQTSVVTLIDSYNELLADRAALTEGNSELKNKMDKQILSAEKCLLNVANLAKQICDKDFCYEIKTKFRAIKSLIDAYEIQPVEEELTSLQNISTTPLVTNVHLNILLTPPASNVASQIITNAPRQTPRRLNTVFGNSTYSPSFYQALSGFDARISERVNQIMERLSNLDSFNANTSPPRNGA